MKDITIKKVQEFLKRPQQYILGEKDGDSLKLKRDYIVNSILMNTEEESYAELLRRLKSEFNCRFYYQTRSDIYLWLNIIEV